MSTTTSNVEQVETVVRDLKKLQEQQAGLMVKLQQSMAVESVWAKAFATGHCRFGGVRKTTGRAYSFKGLAWTEAWLISGNGVKYQLNKVELNVIRPGDSIHPEWSGE